MSFLPVDPESAEDIEKQHNQYLFRLFVGAHKMLAVLLVVQWALVLSYLHDHLLSPETLLGLLLLVTFFSWAPVGFGLLYPRSFLTRHFSTICSQYLACGLMSLTHGGMDLRACTWLMMVVFRDTSLFVTGFLCLELFSNVPQLLAPFGDTSPLPLNSPMQLMLVVLGLLSAVSNRTARAEIWNTAVRQVDRDRKLREDHKRQIAEQEYENIALDIILDGVQRASAQVRHVVTRLAAMAEDQEESTRQQAATAGQISETCATIQDSAEDLAEFASQVSDEAAHTARQAQSGRDVLQAIQTRLAKIGTDAQTIGDRFGQLSERANRVAGVADTIHGVTKDTRLLSLNAAVEAEKAGEHGRGFGVVAQEIRRLAQQTSELLEEIERLLREVQSAVSGGVMGMEQFTEEVRRSTESAHGVSSQVEKILEQTQDMSESFKEIYRITSAQVSSLQAISHETDQLDRATRSQNQNLIELNRNVSFLEQVTNNLANLVASQKRLSSS